MNTIEQARNVSSQCKTTATNPMSTNIMVDGGSGTLRDLLTDAADTIDTLIAELADAKASEIELQACINDMCDAIPDYDGSGGAAGLIGKAFAELTALKQQEPVGYMVETNDGPFFFPIEDYDEAMTYCDDDEFPAKLYLAAGAQQVQAVVKESFTTQEQP